MRELAVAVPLNTMLLLVLVCLTLVPHTAAAPEVMLQACMDAINHAKHLLHHSNLTQPEQIANVERTIHECSDQHRVWSQGPHDIVLNVESQLLDILCHIISYAAGKCPY